MILKTKLAHLLARQNIGKHMVWSLMGPEFREKYEKNADEIIELFTNSIKNLEFMVK